MYCCVLKETNFKIALTVSACAKLENWLKANRHTKPDVSQAIKYIYINLNMCCGNETIKFVITTKFLGVQIDNNLT